MGNDPIRTVKLTPYRRGTGPTYTLTMWDGGRPYQGGPQWAVSYRLDEHSTDGETTVLFEGDDYGCSPCHAIDSEESVAGLLSFLTLRPGDKADAYFEGYTPRQLEFCENHAESLAMEAIARFGED